MFGLLDFSEVYTAQLLGFERQWKDNCDSCSGRSRKLSGQEGQLPSPVRRSACGKGKGLNPQGRAPRRRGDTLSVVKTLMRWNCFIGGPCRAAAVVTWRV